jgi:hypothetical protein
MISMLLLAVIATHHPHHHKRHHANPEKQLVRCGDVYCVTPDGQAFLPGKPVYMHGIRDHSSPPAADDDKTMGDPQTATLPWTESQLRHCYAGATDARDEVCDPPDPMDVPAVKMSHPAGTICRHGDCVVVEAPYETWTCTDKRRVLLTSEDGDKHCILFVKEQP